MNVSAVGNGAATAGSGSAGFSGAASGADFETFLRMLTAQLRNQDPLNPMQGADFAVQLATFAGVEQQAHTNKLLAQMAGASGGGNFAAWIGKEARTTAPVWFSGRPVTLDIAPDPSADSVQLVTRSGTGVVIDRTEIGPGSGQVDWTGQRDDGTRLPDGQYSFTLESRRDGRLVAETKVGAYGLITEATFGPDGTRLIFQGGGSAPASEVTALRAPP